MGQLKLLVTLRNCVRGPCQMMDQNGMGKLSEWLITFSIQYLFTSRFLNGCPIERIECQNFLLMPTVCKSSKKELLMSKFELGYIRMCVYIYSNKIMKYMYAHIGC